MSTTQIQLSKPAILTENACKTLYQNGIDKMQASILVHGPVLNLVVAERFRDTMVRSVPFSDKLKPS